MRWSLGSESSVFLSEEEVGSIVALVSISVGVDGRSVAVGDEDSLPERRLGESMWGELVATGFHGILCTSIVDLRAESCTRQLSCFNRNYG